MLRRVSVNGRESPAPEACAVARFHTVPTRFVPASWQALQLALASDDPTRFYAGMGTMHLTRLAELTSVATARFLPQN